MRKLLSLVFLVSVGCDDGATPTTTRIDSAGVSIVTMSPDTSGLPKWRLSDEPELALGARDDVPGHDLYQVNHAVQLQDGRLVVADGGSGELRYFDQTGELTTRVGGRGEGPGEFQWFGWLRRRPGDSVLVYDPFQQRLSMFDPAGHLVRTSPVRGYDSIPFPGLEMAWESRTLLLRRGLLPPSFSDVQRPAFQLYLGRLGESAVELVGEYAGDAGYHLQSNQSVTVWPVPFGPRTAVAAHDDRWYVGDNARFVIDVFAPDGRQTHSFRRADPPVPVTASDVEQFVAEVLTGIPVERRDRLAAVLEDVEAPSTQPTFGAANHLRQLPSLLPAQDGTLWVLEYTWQRDAPTRWMVVDSSGVAVGQVVLPPHHAPLYIARELVIIHVRDALDVETVRVHRLVQAGQEPAQAA